MTVMTSWDVFEDLRAAQDEMLRFTRGNLARPGQQYDAGTSTQAWAPALEITERKDAYLVTVELPGVQMSDVECTFQDGLLTIQGERHTMHDAAGEKVHRSERYYGAFRRSITLPSHVEADKIEATCQDGILQVFVPKAQDMRAKRIQVRAGKGQTAVTSASGKAAKNGS
jgi:HSP20 family protein